MTHKEGLVRSSRVLIGLTVINLTLLIAQLTRVARASTARETVRARAIELIDERGRVRAQLSVETDGEALFRLRDAEGEIRVKLGGGREGSGLLLLDGSTEPGIHLLAGSSGTSVTLRRDGRHRAITPD
jgi:hypothetical protein